MIFFSAQYCEAATVIVPNISWVDIIYLTVCIKTSYWDIVFLLLTHNHHHNVSTDTINRLTHIIIISKMTTQNYYWLFIVGICYIYSRLKVAK